MEVQRPVERQIQIRSTKGSIEGVLRTSPSLRTLDDLNLLAREFITIHGPNIDGEVWEPDTRVASRKIGQKYASLRRFRSVFGHAEFPVRLLAAE